MKIKRKFLSFFLVFTLMISVSFVNTINVKAATTGQAIVSYSKQFLGTPYVWGGTTPRGFDCSGFVQYVYRHFGISLPRTTYDQVNCGRHISRANLGLGDLIFFHHKSRGPEHVGIYIGNGQYIQSPHRGDVIKISRLGSYYTARRIINSSSPHKTCGYHQEGIQCYVYPSQKSGTVPLYRYYNGTEHFYTTNYGELGEGRLGYKKEGIQCYIYSSQKPGTVPLYRYCNETEHFYTTNHNEIK